MLATIGGDGQLVGLAVDWKESGPGNDQADRVEEVSLRIVLAHHGEAAVVRDVDRPEHADREDVALAVDGDLGPGIRTRIERWIGWIGRIERAPPHRIAARGELGQPGARLLVGDQSEHDRAIGRDRHDPIWAGRPRPGDLELRRDVSLTTAGARPVVVITGRFTAAGGRQTDHGPPARLHDELHDASR
jgi:hypothetical protein